MRQLELFEEPHEQLELFEQHPVPAPVRRMNRIAPMTIAIEALRSGRCSAIRPESWMGEWLILTADGDFRFEGGATPGFMAISLTWPWVMRP